ncbi:hypothetical protein PMAYCL1PPCAC_11666, partial [Pristionchus mayeri]
GGVAKEGEKLDDESDDDLIVTKVVIQPKKSTATEVRQDSREQSVAEANDDVVEDLAEEEDGEQRAVVREFAPVHDEDLCVVAEVENTGYSIAPPTTQQREKKYACPKCSDKFITQARLTNHLDTHMFDAGQSTIMEELGIPLMSRLWICKNCCLAFSSPEARAEHNAQHGRKSFSCECCSGVAFTESVLKQHHEMIGNVSYICGECKLKFNSDVALHEHSRDTHSVALFSFCKGCDMGTTDVAAVYHHYLTGCARAAHRPQTMGHANDMMKWMGVIPAGLLHFQPTHLATVKMAMRENPSRFVRPSVCSHRSMIVSIGGQVSCNECKCLQHIQNYIAELHSKGLNWDSRARPAFHAPPFYSFKAAYDRKVAQTIKDQSVQQSSQQVATPMTGGQPNLPCPNVMMTPGADDGRPPPIAKAPAHCVASSSGIMAASRQVIHRMDEKMAATAEKRRQLQQMRQPATMRLPYVRPAARGAHGGMMRGGPARPACVRGGRAVLGLPGGSMRSVSEIGRGRETATRGRDSQLITPARANTVGGSGSYLIHRPIFSLPQPPTLNGFHAPPIVGSTMAPIVSGFLAPSGMGGSDLIHPPIVSLPQPPILNGFHAPLMMAGSHLPSPLTSQGGARPFVFWQPAAATCSSSGSGAGASDRIATTVAGGRENGGAADPMSSDLIHPPNISLPLSLQKSSTTAANPSMPSPSLNR